MGGRSCLVRGVVRLNALVGRKSWWVGGVGGCEELVSEITELVILWNVTELDEI